MTAIMGVLLDNRLEEAVKFQEILTECGCDIRTRIGLHNIGEYKCVNSGIILLDSRYIYLQEFKVGAL